MRLIPSHALGFRTRLTDIRLSQLEVLGVCERMSRTVTVSSPRDEVLMLSPETGEGVHYCLEGRFGLGELVVVSRTISSVWRICAPLQWGAIVGEQAYLPAHRVALWRPRRAAFRALFNFQRVVVHCTVRRPEAAVETDTAYGLEQQLLTALIEVLTDMPAKTG